MASTKVTIDLAKLSHEALVALLQTTHGDTPFGKKSESEGAQKFVQKVAIEPHTPAQPVQPVQQAQKVEPVQPVQPPQPSPPVIQRSIKIEVNSGANISLHHINLIRKYFQATYKPIESHHVVKLSHKYYLYLNFSESGDFIREIIEKKNYILEDDTKLEVTRCKSIAIPSDIQDEISKLPDGNKSGIIYIGFDETPVTKVQLLTALSKFKLQSYHIELGMSKDRTKYNAKVYMNSVKYAMMLIEKKDHLATELDIDPDNFQVKYYKPKKLDTSKLTTIYLGLGVKAYSEDTIRGILSSNGIDVMQVYLPTSVKSKLNCAFVQTPEYAQVQKAIQLKETFAEQFGIPLGQFTIGAKFTRGI